MFPALGGTKMINAPKLPVSLYDRHLLCQEEVDAPLQDILDQATTHGWGTLEAISAMEEVLRNLRLAYSQADDAPTDSNEGHAFIHGRGGEEKL
jgi:hypothetical protein